MERFDDWPERLAKLLEDAGRRSFVRGRHDCALFAGEAVFVMTGVDPRASFLGKYKTKRGAVGILKRYAGTLLETAERMAADLGAIEVDRPFAQRGDIAYVEIGDDSALAVMNMSGQFVTTGPKIEGLLVVPPECVLRVWRVG